MTFIDNDNLDFKDQTPIEDNVAYLPEALKGGLIVGAIGVALFLVGTLTGFNNPSNLAGLAIFGLASLAINIFLYRKFMLDHRNNRLGGYMSFGRAFLFFLVMSLVASLIGVFFQYIYYAFIDPNALEVMKEGSMEMLEKMGADESIVETQREQMDEQFQLGSIIQQGLMYSLIGSAVMGLIFAAVLKKVKQLTR
jgi:Protein of unknown function (DUF4199)